MVQDPGCEEWIAYTCMNCGTHVPDGASHQCTPVDHDNRMDYKCPKCKGEFNNPAGKFKNRKCPWCGEQMKGMEV